MMQILKNKTWDKYVKVISPKILGAINLQDNIVNNNLTLDFFISFSSISFVLGNMGQANYAAANAFLDTFANYQRQTNSSNQY